MLVLTRRLNESISLGSDIQITLLDTRRAQAKIGIVAPRDLPVMRTEIETPITEYALRDRIKRVATAIQVGMSRQDRIGYEHALLLNDLANVYEWAGKGEFYASCLALIRVLESMISYQGDGFEAIMIPPVTEGVES